MPHKELQDPDDQLTFLIGQIERADVAAENGMRHVYGQLTKPGLGAAVMPRDFARLLSDAQTMVDAAVDLDPAMSATSREVFAAARRAHTERGRLSHELWIPELLGVEWSASRTRSEHILGIPPATEPTTKVLADFEQCRDDLLVVGWRINALNVLLPGYLGRPDVVGERPGNRRVWAAIALGKIALADPPGAIAILDDSPNALDPRLPVQTEGR